MKLITISLIMLIIKNFVYSEKLEISDLLNLNEKVEISEDIIRLKAEGAKYDGVVKSLNITETFTGNLLQVNKLEIESIVIQKYKSSKEELNSVCSNKKINSFILSDTIFDDSHAKILCNSKLITILGLDGTKITDEGLKYLADIEELGLLSLKNTSITVEGLLYFKKSKDSGFYVSDVDLDYTNIDKLKALDKSNILYLGGKYFTYKDLDKFDALKKFRIVRLNPGKMSDVEIEKAKKRFPWLRIIVNSKAI